MRTICSFNIYKVKLQGLVITVLRACSNCFYSCNFPIESVHIFKHHPSCYNLLPRDFHFCRKKPLRGFFFLFLTLKKSSCVAKPICILHFNVGFFVTLQFSPSLLLSLACVCSHTHTCPHLHAHTRSDLPVSLSHLGR